VEDVGSARVDPGEASLVVAARAGDETAFRRLTEPYVHELHVHCYRMLASLHDAEDAVQETLLRAWRRLDTFAARASFRAWLYGIATNACLDELGRHPRRLPPRAHGPPTDPFRVSHAPPTAEVTRLEPYPDVLLDRLAADPQARAIERETIELAFLTAIQLLPPRQRAVLILRDVLGWAASEAAELLDTSVAAVNSALQRAHATLDVRTSLRRKPDSTEASLVRRYMRVWEEADMAALAALLRDDAVLTMPPSPSWYVGPAAIVEFVSTFVFADPPPRLRLVPTRANRQPACAVYIVDPEAGVCRGYGFMVMRFARGGVAEITGFADPGLFRFFELPATASDEQLRRLGAS
jgi:RNA polymerase sigma-70 factor (ECF subfamily)